MKRCAFINDKPFLKECRRRLKRTDLITSKDHPAVMWDQNRILFPLVRSLLVVYGCRVNKLCWNYDTHWENQITICYNKYHSEHKPTERMVSDNNTAGNIRSGLTARSSLRASPAVTWTLQKNLFQVNQHWKSYNKFGASLSSSCIGNSLFSL